MVFLVLGSLNHFSCAMIAESFFQYSVFIFLSISPASALVSIIDALSVNPNALTPDTYVNQGAEAVTGSNKLNT